MGLDAGREIVGVLGGMGPLASAEFLKTIYESSRYEREQDAPAVIVYSDPSFPDRTEAILTGRDDELLARLCAALEWLEGQRASTIVICCVTIHYLLDRLSPARRARIRALTDVILERVIRERRRYLLLCTEGTRRSGVFETHPLWDRARDFVVLPTDRDQRTVHELIYDVKVRREGGDTCERLDALRRRHGVDGLIAACTELHIVLKRLRASGVPWCCVDPLAIIAEELGHHLEKSERIGVHAS